jgi:hypothetical protein
MIRRRKFCIIQACVHIVLYITAALCRLLCVAAVALLSLKLPAMCALPASTAYNTAAQLLLTSCRLFCTCLQATAGTATTLCGRALSTAGTPRAALPRTTST